jgi:leader peptidase (prepilin peptidase)/N-methyltransferase
VLGWLLLRGRCRDCGATISPRYAIVEAIMGAAFVLLAYAEVFTGAANVPGGPFAESAGAWHNFWNPNWIVLRIAIYHGLLLSLLTAMALIDQDRQRVPWSIVVFAAAVAAYSSWAWRHLYFERTRNIRLPEVKAQVDAALGSLWAASPWVASAGVAYFLRRRDALNTLRSLAMAGAVVGAFLGLRPAVRITVICVVAWLITWLIVRALPAGRRKRPTLLALVWCATLAHIVFWKPLVGAISW